MLLKNKKSGAAYIDTILTVFLCLVILAVSISVFQTMYSYQKLDDIATNTLEYASVKGKIANDNDVKDKIEDLIVSNGFKLDDVSYSFNNSELIFQDGSYTENVQYGDNIMLEIKTDINIGFVNSDGFLTIPVEISKSTVSQKYWK